MYRQDNACDRPAACGLLMTLAVCSLLVLPAPVEAQETERSTDRGEEAEAAVAEVITVTARKREEELQRVPLSITVFDHEAIEKAEIKNAEDIALQTPNMTFSPLFGGAVGVPVIRGLSQTIGEPNVGFFLDGVYQNSRTAMDALLAVDVQRVEVIKAPQSALYGRNTFAGAVNLVTRAPRTVGGGSASLQAGSHSQVQGSAYYTGPLAGDELFVQLGGTYFTRDSYYTNELTGGDLDDRRTAAGSLALQWQPNERGSLRWRLALEDTSDGDDPLQFVENNAAFFEVIPGLGDFQVFEGDLPGITSGFAVTPGSRERENLQTNLTANYLFDRVLLTSITGYNDLSHAHVYDSSYEPRPIHSTRDILDEEEISQEIRVSSVDTVGWNWLAGVYYYDLDSTQDFTAAFVGPAAPFGGLGTVTDATTESFSVFGQVGIDLSDRARLSLAGRWAREEKSVRAVDTDLASGAQAVFEDRDRWSHFTPSASLDIQIDDRHMLYTSVANAIKAGGFNVVTTAGAILPDERAFDPEESWHFELGSKSTLMDGRAFLNLAVFHIRWRDQIVRALGETFAVLNTNAGKTTSQGVEAAFTLRTPAGLDLDLGFGYTDATYDEYTFGALVQVGLDPVLDGVQLTFTSKTTANAALQYTTPDPVSRDFRWFGRADGSFRQRQPVWPTGDGSVGDLTRVNLATGLDNGRWRFSVWVKNATADDAPLTAVIIPNPVVTFDAFTGGRGGFQIFQSLVNAPEPRTWGVSTRVRF